MHLLLAIHKTPSEIPGLLRLLHWSQRQCLQAPLHHWFFSPTLPTPLPKALNLLIINNTLLKLKKMLLPFVFVWVGRFVCFFVCLVSQGLSVVPTSLKLTMQTKLASSSQRFACLYLPSTG